MRLSGAVERAQNIARAVLESRARRVLEREPLWPLLEEYRRRSQSAGCQYVDYLCLYQTVRKQRPIEILECGTGVSTLVLAAALAENEREGAPRGRLTSVDDIEQWYRLSRDLLPDSLRPYVDFVLSPRREYTWSIFRGVGYQDLPERPYSLVFVDGPGVVAPSDGAKTFDFDFINVVKRSSIPVSGIIDQRISTCFVLQKALGAHKVRYDPVRNLGFVGPCTSKDLRAFRGSSSQAFVLGIPFLPGNHFDLRIEREP